MVEHFSDTIVGGGSPIVSNSSGPDRIFSYNCPIVNARSGVPLHRLLVFPWRHPSGLARQLHLGLDQKVNSRDWKTKDTYM